MKRFLVFVISLACLTGICGAAISEGISHGDDRLATGGMVTGVNLGYVPAPSQQNEAITQLRAAGVNTVRMGLQDPNAVPFMATAYNSGIKSIALLNTAIGAIPTSGCPRAAIGQKGTVPCLSDANASGFKAAVIPRLDALEASGVKLAAIEVGNELNWYFSNGDFPVAGTGRNGAGRVLGLDALNNPNDAEGKRIAAGYLAYLQVAKVVREWRDSSKLNRTTPILSVGLYDPGLPGDAVHTWQNVDAVGVSATLKFLQAHGLDSLVDGYSIHSYPVATPGITAAQRAQTLEEDAFRMCGLTKPCWLTEWGFRTQVNPCPLGNGPSVDATNVSLVSTLRAALRGFAGQHRLVGMLYYDWSTSNLAVSPNSFPIYGQFPSCGPTGAPGLTRSGREAIAPLQ